MMQTNAPMTPVLMQTLRSSWMVLALHAGLWLLVGVIILRLGGHSPDFHEANANSTAPQATIPVARFDSVFTSSQWPKPFANSNLDNPFLTRHFIPTAPPPPPPPTTRKIEITYQGYYQAGDNPYDAILKIGDAFVVARIGTTIATNLFVAQATMQTLTLTNFAAQTNVLTVNVKKEIEVPLK
jgi:hypothetical protein